jgi:hypothetical protein
MLLASRTGPSTRHGCAWGPTNVKNEMTTANICSYDGAYSLPLRSRAQPPWPFLCALSRTSLVGSPQTLVFPVSWAQDKRRITGFHSIVGLFSWE